VLASQSTGEARGRTSGGDRLEDGLAAQLAAVAQSLQAEPDMTETLQAAVRAAVVNVPGAEYAGITWVTDRGRRVSTPAATHELVEHIDRVQYETGQGPCLQAIRDQITVRADDLTVDQRWPAFAARAVEAGIRSMLCFQLFVRDHDLGALNLFSATVAAFDEQDEAIGLLLASHAAVALIGAQEQQHLRAGMDSRDLIGQAKGMLMERYHIHADKAFAFLVRLSQDNNTRLVEIAAHASTPHGTQPPPTLPNPTDRPPQSVSPGRLDASLALSR
jgi:putative methionine-R-sulfoxide reductase with GAF domain